MITSTQTRNLQSFSFLLLSVVEGFPSQFLYLGMKVSTKIAFTKTGSAIDAKVVRLLIYVEAIIYLLLYNLHDCAFKTFCQNWPNTLFTEHLLVATLE